MEITSLTLLTILLSSFIGISIYLLVGILIDLKYPSARELGWSLKHEVYMLLLALAGVVGVLGLLSHL